MARKIKAVLFDFDGTLIDTNQVVIQSFQHTYLHFWGHEVEEARITRVFGEPLTETMEREFGPRAEEAILYYREYQRIHKEELVRSFKGIAELLEELKSRGYRMAVVTSRTAASTADYMRLFHMTDYFEAVVSCDDTGRHKPDPEPINLGLKKLGLRPEDVIMVGDGVFDIKCANNAGVISVLVGWRITSGAGQLISDAREDYQVETPADLLTLLEGLEK